MPQGDEKKDAVSLKDTAFLDIKTGGKDGKVERFVFDKKLENGSFKFDNKVESEAGKVVTNAVAFVKPDGYSTIIPKKRDVNQKLVDDVDNTVFVKLNAASKDTSPKGGLFVADDRYAPTSDKHTTGNFKSGGPVGDSILTDMKTSLNEVKEMRAIAKAQQQAQIEQAAMNVQEQKPTTPRPATPTP